MASTQSSTQDKLPFAPATAKFTIGSLDEPNDPELTIVAQYNPAELQVDQNVPWTKPTATNKTGEIRLEFTGAEGRGVQVDLLFDGYEDDRDITKQIKGLTRLSTVRVNNGDTAAVRRPHHCVVLWGDRGLPSFRCVVASLSVKYQKFSSDGKPLRATATVKLTEADTVTLAKIPA